MRVCIRLCLFVSMRASLRLSEHVCGHQRAINAL
jgi:hypothetical protein